MGPAREPPRMLLLCTEVFANGGIQRFNQTLLAALALLKVRCDVLSVNDTQESIGRVDPQTNIQVTGFAGKRRRFAAAAILAIWRRRYDWVLVGHINLLSMTAVALAARPASPAGMLFIAHGIEVWYGINRRRRYALNRASKILCVSGYTRGRILQQVPSLRSERLRLFPNALGESWARQEPRPMPQKLPQRFILSVTRLQKGDRYKGVVTVIEALSMLRDASLQYRVVGHGDDVAFLKRVARRFGVEHRVHFLSEVDDRELVNLYGQCEAFVLPSGKEGFGIVFLEAMFFGAPVIAAAEKGALDVVKDGETGLLVRFGDSIALQRAIERLAADDALRAKLRQGGRATVVADGAFTFQRFVERTADVLEIPRARVA